MPSTPAIDVGRCWRSLHSVVIVLCPLENDDDVVDGYEVLYCSNDQKTMGQQVGVYNVLMSRERNYFIELNF